MSVDKPTLTPQVEDYLMGPKIEKHPLIEKRKIRLPARTILWKSYFQRENTYHSSYLTISHTCLPCLLSRLVSPCVHGVIEGSEDAALV